MSTPPPATSPSTTLPPRLQPELPPSPILSTRSFKQLGVFAGGASFLLLSSLMTRRALRRKYIATIPKFYNFSTASPPPQNGAVEALEALTIATSYVFSSAIMMVGGGLWAMDISNVDEFRTVARRQMYGVHGSGDGSDTGRKVDEEAEKEIEEWMAGVLAKKEVREMAKEMARGPPNGRGEQYGWPKEAGK